jgi:hypothetical protein
MKLNVWHFAGLIVMVLVLASRAEYAAQLGVLGLTLGIFFGTLSLRKPGSADATSTNPGHG